MNHHRVNPQLTPLWLMYVESLQDELSPSGLLLDSEWVKLVRLAVPCRVVQVMPRHEAKVNKCRDLEGEKD